MADEALIAEVEAKIEALKLRLPGLEGKANKRERTAVNKEIYTLENDEAYADAVKARLEGARAGAAAADDAEHAAKLAAEKDKEAANAEAGAAARARRLAEAEAAAKADDDGEVHVSKVQLKKGDGATYPSKGEQVLVTYQGRFADGTSHEGRDFSGAEFDSTWDSKKKAHKPLSFPFGVGKVVRGWDEALKEMSLGESAELTIGPKWAYKKGGVTDDKGAYVVPPNATLIFNMTLVGVGAKKVDP